MKQVTLKTFFAYYFQTLNLFHISKTLNLFQTLKTRISIPEQSLYPPGRIMHIIPIAHSSENPNSNHNGCDEKHVSLYETPRELYGKLRLSRRMILDHKSNKYLKVLQQLINQLEKESFKYHGG